METRKPDQEPLNEAVAPETETGSKPETKPEPKKDEKPLRLEVDLGDETRQIVAGIAKAYAPLQLVGRRIIVVANLKPATLRGVESQGMLLAADLNGVPTLATFEGEVPPGTPVH